MPVIYHDWILSETGLRIPVSSVSLNEFQSLGPRQSDRYRRNKRLPNQGGSASDDASELLQLRNVDRASSLVELNALNHRDRALSRAQLKHYGGRGDVAIKAPFATLAELLQV